MPEVTRQFREGDNMQQLLIDTELAAEKACQDGRIAVVTVKSMTEAQYRTHKQQKAIEVYCKLAAEALNDAGYDMNVVLGEAETETPWTQESFKGTVWRKMQLAMGYPKSTTKLNTGDVSKIYDVVNRGVIAKRGISLPFPSIENQCRESIVKK